MEKKRKKSKTTWDNPLLDFLFEILFEMGWAMIRAACRGVLRFIKHMGDFIPG
jgi:hypothetical protein